MTAAQTFPLTPEGITEAMRSLDLESWEIAEKLQAAGVKGVQGNECQCALAAYLAFVLPSATEVFVEATQVRISGEIEEEFGFRWPVTLTSPLPDGAQDFVPRFDRGDYPDLIAAVVLAPEGNEEQ